MFKRRRYLSQEEEELIRDCLRNDRRAQNRLYQLFGARMFSVCYRFSRNREEAEDTFIEAFMKVFDNLRHFSKKGSLEGWIRRIMVNTAIEKYRSSHKTVSVTVSLDNARTEISALFEDSATALEANDLMRYIRALPECYRMVFNLFVLEGFSHKEISVMLGISIGTSKSNLSDARSLLRKRISHAMTPAISI